MVFGVFWMIVNLDLASTPIPFEKSKQNDMDIRLSQVLTKAKEHASALKQNKKSTKSTMYEEDCSQARILTEPGRIQRIEELKKENKEKTIQKIQKSKTNKSLRDEKSQEDSDWEPNNQVTKYHIKKKM